MFWLVGTGRGLLKFQSKDLTRGQGSARAGHGLPQAMGETISLWLPPHLPSAGAPRALNSGWVSIPTGPFPFMGVTRCSKNQNKDATAGMVTGGPPQHLQQEPQRAPTALRKGAAPPQRQFKKFLPHPVSSSQENQRFAGGAAHSLAQHR